MSFITYETLISAFPANPLPEATSICMPSSNDEGVGAFFHGRAWTDLTEADLRDHDFAPTIFTPQAFHYFLPAYLRWFYGTLDNLDALGESVIINLGADVFTNSPPVGRAHMIYSSFTDEQLVLVRKFIADYVAIGGACAAIICCDAVALYHCKSGSSPQGRCQVPE